MKNHILRISIKKATICMDIGSTFSQKLQIVTASVSKMGLFGAKNFRFPLFLFGIYIIMV